MIQWTYHPAGFGMQVEHRGFEVSVAEHNLKIAHKSPVLQTDGSVIGENRAFLLVELESVFDLTSPP